MSVPFLQLPYLPRLPRLSRSLPAGGSSPEPPRPPWPDRVAGLRRSLSGVASGRALAGWAAAAALLLAGLGLTARAQRQAYDARAAWGALATVWTTRAPIAAGELLTEANVTTRSLPRAVLADGALADGVASTEVIGRRARVALAAGEVLLDGRLGLPGAGAATALLDAGAVALAVPEQWGPAGLQPGDAVVLVLTGATPPANGPVNGAAPEPAGGSPAVAGRVVGRDRERAELSVAVAALDAVRVAGAIRRDELVVAARRDEALSPRPPTG